MINILIHYSVQGENDIKLFIEKIIGGKYMKQKITKTLLAVTLCTAMLGSTALAASGELTDPAQGGTVTGDSTVENPKYKIVVPTSLVFAIDPFEQKGQSQIYSEDFSMINKSNVPVRLDCSVSLSAGTGVTIKDAASDVTETGTDKLVYMEAEIPSAVTETSAAAAAYADSLAKDSNNDYYLNSLSVSGATEVTDEMVDTTAAAGTYTQNAKVGLKSSAATKLTFALNKADYTTYYTVADKSASDKQFKNVAASQAGSATFRFSGKVNSKASWANSAVTATVAYTFNGLSDTNYTALMTKQVANTHGYVVEDTDPSITATGTYNKATGAITATVNLGTGAKATTIKSVTYGSNNNPTTVLPSANYSVTGSTFNGTAEQFVIDAWASRTDPCYMKVTLNGIGGGEDITQLVTLTVQ